MVSYAGEAAVSGVSLVNMLNTFFIFLFTALASGGAVVVSQLHRQQGRGKQQPGRRAAVHPRLPVLPGVHGGHFGVEPPLLGLLFGQVEPDVMEASAIYLRISAYSYPFLALYTPGRPCTAA